MLQEKKLLRTRIFTVINSVETEFVNVGSKIIHLSENRPQHLPDLHLLQQWALDLTHCLETSPE